jgi:hypothetical protein
VQWPLGTLNINSVIIKIPLIRLSGLLCIDYPEEFDLQISHLNQSGFEKASKK